MIKKKVVKFNLLLNSFSALLCFANLIFMNSWKIIFLILFVANTACVIWNAKNLIQIRRQEKQSTIKSDAVCD